MNTFKFLSSAVLALALAGCGGGGDSSSSSAPGTTTPLTGVFLDAPVAGITYKTETRSGVTNDNGEFQYLSGETVTFRVGSVTLPSVLAGPTITPLDMAGTQDMASRVAANILVFLQSLDQDGIPGNGITIATNAANAATQSLNFDVPVADFVGSTGFTRLVANAGGSNVVPVSVDAALNHFATTLKSRNIAAAPVANAGTAQNVVTGTTVTLNGSGSTDANGDTLTYAWSLSSRPAGSSAALTGATTVNPTFVADVAGSYVLSLTVNDGKLNSTPATVTVTAAVANAAPVANAGTAQNVVTGTTVTLNGSGSTDANGDTLTYAWSLSSRPAGSSAALTGATTVNPTFVADVAGTYVAALVVNDGKVNSAPSSVSIDVATPVGGLLSASARWTVEKSPYVLTSNLLIPAGVTLAIEPGVRVIGRGLQIQVAGTFSVEGVTENRATLDNLNILRASSVGATPYMIQIVGASVIGGSVYSTGGSWGPGSFVLTDSRLSGVDYLYLHYPTGTNKIERNVFTNSGGISFGIGSSNVGDGMAGSLSITNNAFIGWTSGYAVQNWATYASGSSSVRLNSFLSTDRIAVSLPDGYTSVTLDAANNYWGTVDTTVIQSMIYDRTKSLLSGGTVNYMPILAAPDPSTPK